MGTTVNPLYTAMEVIKHVQDSKPKSIIVVRELWDNIKDMGLLAIVMKIATFERKYCDINISGASVLSSYLY
jgi:2-polyprenyl-3-methyl-5-hydroxy-6-metoxy-1,4-benzoquinol methylase